MDWLGKILFRRSQAHERRRKLRALKAAIIVGLVIAGLLAVAFYWADVHGRR